MFVLSLNLPAVTLTSSARMSSVFNPLWKVPIPVAVIPAPKTATPDLAVTIPTESILVTSSYVIVPPTLIELENQQIQIKVPATPVILLTVISVRSRVISWRFR